MQGVGQRLRERARELGLSDTAVAERLEMSQQRYANYVRDAAEPDLETFGRICRALGMSADRALGLSEHASTTSDEERLRARIDVSLGRMDPTRLRTAVAVVEALADEGRVSKAGSARRS